MILPYLTLPYLTPDSLVTCADADAATLQAYVDAGQLPSGDYAHGFMTSRRAGNTQTHT